MNLGQLGPGKASSTRSFHCVASFADVFAGDPRTSIVKTLLMPQRAEKVDTLPSSVVTATHIMVTPLMLRHR